ncbi:uncharacterized protein METZ01_LOCUS240631 [marine metagenome]|uniref:Uncharacterized protein n=1 Tax=marine metagenome TaxID=408172 RepID=A0A382HLH1_9ZZZZ|tara:strand:+ start:332 stop:679 length:348 start_codon:yes stop_codon:yes gene_type:complete
MAIPSGSGTEVLKRSVTTTTDSGAKKLIDGVADHVYTVLSIVVCETAGASETFNLYVDNGSGTAYELLSDQAIGANKTFIWNDRIVLSGVDELTLAVGNTCDVDIYCSYIDQDWS